MESKIKEKNGTFKLKFKCGFGLDRTQGGCQSVPCGHLVFSTIKPQLNFGCWNSLGYGFEI
jgi:hypothetical protein